MARIYTRTGDKGDTGLVGGARVSKDSLRVEAYGNIDELNAILGMARALLKEENLCDLLGELQKDLFVAGADLASPTESRPDLPRINKDGIGELEKTIDRFETELTPLKAFILPGGSAAGSMLHYARTVARRAERRIVTLSRAEKINEQMIPYINRLSDLLFVMARVANLHDNAPEVQWHGSD